MTQLTLQNFATLVQNLCSAAQGNSSAALNLEEGSVLLSIFQADASQALWLQYLIVLQLAVTRLATSNGTDCDSFGADFDFTRLPASSAIGQVTFSRYTPSQAAFIPIYAAATSTTAASGTQVLTADGTQTFDVIADPSNPNYVSSPIAGYNLVAGAASITVPVVADSPGSAGNVLAGVISLIVGGIPGIDTVNNANATTGGVNAESDSAFRLRFVNFINSRAQGTATAVAYAIQQVQQGLSWSILENQTSNGSYQPGTFVVTIDDGSGAPPSSLISTCAAAINAVRPIGSTMIVQGPSEILAAVQAILTLAPNANAIIIVAEVNAAITSYITSLAVGQTMPYNRIAQVIFDADSSIINISGVLLNGGVNDLIPAETQVIRPGAITVSAT